MFGKSWVKWPFYSAMRVGDGWYERKVAILLQIISDRSQRFLLFSLFCFSSFLYYQRSSPLLAILGLVQLSQLAATATATAITWQRSQTVSWESFLTSFMTLRKLFIAHCCTAMGGRSGTADSMYKSWPLLSPSSSQLLVLLLASIPFWTGCSF